AHSPSSNNPACAMSTTYQPVRPQLYTNTTTCTTPDKPSTFFTSQLCLVQGPVMPTVSHSWNASLPIRCVGTCPVMHTTGMESISASVNPVTALVAPGPDVTSTHPTLPVERA